MLLKMGLCARNMLGWEYINKITSLHHVGISHYFMRKKHSQTTLKYLYIWNLPSPPARRSLWRPFCNTKYTLTSLRLSVCMFEVSRNTTRIVMKFYTCADKFLTRPGWKQANVSLSERLEFRSAPCLSKKTWWEHASQCCWNRARPWHASELVSFLVGLRTYQHLGILGSSERVLMNAIGISDLKTSTSISHYFEHFINIGVKETWLKKVLRTTFNTFHMPSKLFSRKFGVIQTNLSDNCWPR